jgi:hypothetical protein
MMREVAKAAISMKMGEHVRRMIVEMNGKPDT